MSGDVGSVGRIVISDTPSGNHDMFLDLKGTIYKTTIVPSRTFCIVNFGQAEAKVCLSTIQFEIPSMSCLSVVYPYLFLTVTKRRLPQKIIG
ncbi:DNA-binding protein BIN4-like [Macadamia integrifolia]|uniref:DNA-binding protein BIN4-like n=1 Tax=Macadamia integrifolia TaxID=60698 RepID=UPI001C4F78C6|nr:DNA-binding protein BIN4-like [Macadamia integrifolia]